MARRASRCTMGVLNNGQIENMRDSCVQSKSHDPSGSRGAYPEIFSGKWRSKQWSNVSQFGAARWTQGLGAYKDGRPKVKNRKILQSNSQPPLFQSGRLGFKESNSEHPGAQSREARSNMGRPLPRFSCHRKRIIRVRESRWRKITKRLELAQLKR